MKPYSGKPAELTDRLAHSRQTRGDVPGGRDVIPAHDGQVIGQANTVVLQASHDGQCDLVVAADESVELDTAPQDLLRDLEPGTLDQGHPQRWTTDGYLGRGMRHTKPCVSLGHVPRGVGVADEHQMGTSMLEEMRCEHGRALEVLGPHRVAASHVLPREQHDGQGVGQGVGNRVRHRVGSDDQAVDALGQLTNCFGGIRPTLDHDDDDAMTQLRGH